MKTKIDERREREAYDQAHPWLPMAEAIINNGVACELLFSDMETSRERLFFLAEDDHWYRIDSPQRLSKVRGWFGDRSPMNWRPTNRKLSPGRRAEIATEANKSHW